MDNLTKTADFWLENEEQNCGYCNRYITVDIYKSEVTNEDIRLLEAAYASDLSKDNYSPDSLIGIMYALTEDGNIHFDVHKGDIDVAKRLSELYKDSVVIAKTDWDCHCFEVWQNGQLYDKWHCTWEVGSPNTYEVNKIQFFDCEAVIHIELPGNDEAVVYFGGNGCSLEEYEEICEYFGEVGLGRC